MAEQNPKGIGRGRGRGLALQRKAAEAAAAAAKEAEKAEEKKEEIKEVGTLEPTSSTSTATPAVTSPPAATGRGRGMAARLAAARSVKQLGEAKEEDVSFRSEEFETSSRIGEAFAKPVDVKAVAGKLEVTKTFGLIR